LIRFDTLWVQNNAKVNFANDFEIYRGANGMKASRSLLMLLRDLPIYLSASALREGQSWLEAP
jgi:hypothetical protein